jgi:regulator of sigma D
MLWLLTMVLALDLASVKSEPNLEKRSDMALDYADSAMDSARDAYKKGDYAKCTQELQQVREAVDLSYESLMATGKDPRKNSKHFKKAEKATRQLLRRLDGLNEIMSVVDRPTIEPVQRRISEVHDALLMGIMTKKKK